MDPTRFDAFTRSLRQTPSRRTALRSTLGGITFAAGWLVAPSKSHAKKKHKKKRHECPECAVCPSPPPVLFCAGKNQCAQTDKRFCNAAETCSC